MWNRIVEIWSTADPVNPVAALILVACYIPFFVRIVLLRRASAEKSGAERRDWTSFVGILLQGLGFFIAFSPPIREDPSVNWQDAAWGAAVPAILALAAVVLFELAARELGRNWSFVARVREDHRLVTSGIFAWIRHPIYLAMLLMMISAGLALGHGVKLIAAIPVFMAGAALRIDREEALLRARFGVDHEAYVKRVARMLPGVW